MNIFLANCDIIPPTCLPVFRRCQTPPPVLSLVFWMTLPKPPLPPPLPHLPSPSPVPYTLPSSPVHPIATGVTLWV